MELMIKFKANVNLAMSDVNEKNYVKIININVSLYAHVYAINVGSVWSNSTLPCT